MSGRTTRSCLHCVVTALFLMLWLTGTAISVNAQQTVIAGQVTDTSGTPIPYVSISTYDGKAGVYSDEDGNFELQPGPETDSIRFSFLGFRTETRPVINGRYQELLVVMCEEGTELGEVVVRSGKRRYRNRDNPAVELIRQVIAHKDSNRIEGYPFARFRQYEKLKFSYSHTAEGIRRDPLLGRYKFLTENLDTGTLAGKALLTWYLEETASDVYFRSVPEKRKVSVYAHKAVQLTEFVDKKGMHQALMHMYREVDLYRDNILIITNPFLSPVAELAPAFYRYYITDTVERDGAKYAELSFFPRNKTDFLFQGKLLVALDGSFAVVRAEMEPNESVNLNWVRRLRVEQDFEKQQDGGYLISRNHMTTDFGIFRRGGPGLFGERTVLFHDYSLGQPLPDSLLAGVSPDTVALADTAADFAVHRPEPLGMRDAATYRNLDSLNRTRSFPLIMDLLTMAVFGYKRVGRHFEFGSVHNIYSFNPIEGRRFRAGGRTTPHLSKHVYGEGYLAYGLGDERWKYFAGMVFSFRDGSIFDFPVCTLRVNYQRDLTIAGQEPGLVQEDNAFLSFKRGENDRWYYNRVWRAEFLHEFRNNFSYRIDLRNRWQQPEGILRFTEAGSQPEHNIASLTTSEVALELRWAPRQEFYQGRVSRSMIPTRFPVIRLRGTAGIKGVLGGEYNYQQLRMHVSKRFYASQLGFTDMVAEGGVLFGQVPYPLLFTPAANQTYSMRLTQFNLMNFMEFVSDRYVALHVDHSFNGFFMNKIPLLRRLGLREVVNAKVFYGGLRSENNPAVSSGLFRFPEDGAGNPATFFPGSLPYLEGSAGVSNIFRFLRVELVKRFNYLDHPGISPLGVRARVQFDF